MITEGILTCLFAVVGVVISLFNLPEMPTALVSIYNSLWTYIQAGLDFVFFLFNKSLLLTCISFLITLFVVLRVVELFKWVWGVLHGKIGKDE